MDILAATAPVSDPGLPYQAIGVVLAALATGITGIVVAILQRQRPAATPSTPPTPGSPGSFMVSETDWLDTRNRAIRVEAALEGLRHEYLQHEMISQEHMGRTNRKIESIEKILGGSTS